MTKQCEECGKNHNPERPHCPSCGQAMVYQDRDCVVGWGCGNQWRSGCGFWIPRNPRQSRRYDSLESESCCECKGFTPHHFWIYDEKGGRRGDWFCVKCYGPLPVGRENVQKQTKALKHPAPLTRGQ